MRKIFLFFCLLASIQSIAQTVATIGAGSTTNATTSNVGPIYRSSASSSFDFSQHYYLFTATELAAIGITNGTTISEIAWNKSGTGATVATNMSSIWQVYMKNSTTAPGATWSSGTFATQSTGATLVYNSSSQVIPAAAGYIPLTLATPFVYTGGNLEVGVNWNCSAFSGNPTTGSIQWLGDNITNQVFGGSNSTATVTMALQTNRPQTRFTFTAPPCSGTPGIGGITSSVTNACTGQPFTLNLTGLTNVGSGATYQWQSSPPGANTWTNLGTAQTSAPYTVASQTAATDYQCIVTCTNGGAMATSSLVAVGQNTFLNCYCVPTTTTINTVDIVAGVTIGSFMSGTVGNVAPLYTLVNNTPVDLAQSAPSSMAITFGTDGTQHSAVWIDYDHSGTFDASENIALSTTAAGASATVTYNFTIPNTALLGQTRMRVRGGSDEVYTAAGACATLTYGETEDYLINITAPPACVGPSAPTNAITSATSVNHSWTAASPAPATGYEWAFTTSATPPASGTATTGTTAASTGLTAGSTYYLHVRSDCGGGTFSTWSTSTPITLAYCAFSSTSSTSFINNFSTTGGSTNISNLATGYSTGGYTDYSATQIVTVQQGSSFNFAGQGNSGFDDGVAIWIDYNDNLVFETSERVYNSAAYLSAFPTGTVSVSASAPVGSHRMRVVIDYNSQNPAACGAITRGEAEDYSVNVVMGTPCSGAPVDATISFTTGTGVYCGGTNSTTMTAVTTSTGTGLTYQWRSRATGSGDPFVDIMGAVNNTYTATNVATSTDYRCVITCGGNSTSSNVIVITINGAPTNDEACSMATPNAIALTLNGAPECGNTTCATSASDPAFSQSSANNTVWYSFTPTTTSTYLLEFTRPMGVTAGLLNGWVGVYTATGTCPTLTFTEVTPALSSFNLPSTATVQLTTTSLTAGTTYYFMIDGVSGAFGAYCIAIKDVPAPACTTNLTPTTGASVGLTPTLTWTAAPLASSYDLYLGTPDLTAAQAATPINVTTTTYTPTTPIATGNYVWYVVPKNATGSAMGCSANNTSFMAAPAVCVPVVSNAICTASGGDSLTVFTLKGEGATIINNYSAADCGNVSASYSDYPMSTVDLAVGKAYAGVMKVGNFTVKASIWIDFNDNLAFEASERLLTELTIDSVTASVNGKPYSIMIPSSATTGVHRMRVRVTGTAQIGADACSAATYGETEDYRVNIVASGAPYVLANPATNACTPIAYTTINSLSNNVSTLVPILNANGEIVAEINANNNELGVVSSSSYLHSGAVRQDVAGQHYLNRNYTISVATQPTTPVTVRLYFSTSDEASLHTANSGTGGQVGDINLTKVDGSTCNSSFGGTGVTYIAQTANGSSMAAGWYYTQFNIASFSSFFLGGGGVALPINIAKISAEATGATNTVSWTTASEANSAKFVVERSVNGTNYSAIGEVATQALSGNSNTTLNYSFVDANPVQGKQYYRLRMVDRSGAAKQSQVVTVRRGNGKLEIVDVRPNPTTSIVYFNVLGVSNNVNVAVRNMQGQTILSKGLVQANGFSIDLSSVANGMYLLEAIDVKTKEKAVYKIVKQ